MPAVAEETRSGVAALAERCRACYQCGRCRSACPQGLDLAGGPRAVVRLILAQDVEPLLASADVWRCSECGACTQACPQGVDVAAILGEVRALQRTAGGPRCPERSGAELSARQLRRRSSLSALALGISLAARGFLPRQRAGALSSGARALRAQARPARAATSPGGDDLFFAGCALRADRGAHAATRALAAGAGMHLAEPAPARCCGHPARDPSLTPPAFDGPVLTACPACERTLARAGTRTVPVWSALVARARRGECRLTARGDRFVPYVGCLAERALTLAMMAEAAELAGAEVVMAHPSLHATCCGALGGVYRGPSQGVLELLRFAAAQGAPIVSPCLLCRDNVRSASRQERCGVQVHFLAEFFQAVPAGAVPIPGVVEVAR
jgi:Fe-S oxidoreductase